MLIRQDSNTHTRFNFPLQNENFKKAINSLKAIDKNFNISKYHSDILIQEFND